MSDRVDWREVPPQHVARWNARLATTHASWRQYPFWNDSCRRIRFRPIYAVATRGNVEIAFVSILSLGIPGFALGLIEKGPVSLIGEATVDADVLESLRSWARARGYAFLRILGYPEQIAILATLPDVLLGDGFGLYGGVGLTELLIPLDKEEKAIFEGLQTTGRRNVRAAQKAGWTVRRSHDPRDLERHWSLVTQMSERKGITFPRPREAWEEVLAAGGASGNATLYFAEHGANTVQMILVLRDAVTAEYLIGALDTGAIGERPSPAALVHWEAIRDARVAGCSFYDIGRPSGPVMQFKRKFNPTERSTLAHCTLICSGTRYRLWSKVALPLAKNGRVAAAEIIARLRSLRGGMTRPESAPEKKE